MDRYIVRSEHTAEECRAAIKHFREYHQGYLNNFEWGCYDNDHTAYLILEADSHEQAMLSVPPLFRSKTKVVKLTHFKPKDKVHADESKTS